MSGKPAARQTDPTSCPLPGHGTNPIATGSPNVLFDNLPAARMTDTSACGSAIEGAVSTSVFINGLPAATVGSTGGHGNVIIGGSASVIIGATPVAAAFAAPAPLALRATTAPAILTAESQAKKAITDTAAPAPPASFMSPSPSVNDRLATAEKILEDFESTEPNTRVFNDRGYPQGSTGDPFEKQQILEQLRLRIARAHGEKIDSGIRLPAYPDQDRTSLCGPAAFFYALLKDRPDLYARSIIELWETGETTIGQLHIKPSHACRNPKNFSRFAPGDRIPSIDWISLASLRDSENGLFSYDSPDDQVAGITLPNALESWFVKAGAAVLFDNIQLSSISLDRLNELFGFLAPAHHVVSLVNAAMVDGGVGFGFGKNHWIVWEGAPETSSGAITSATPPGQRITDSNFFSWGMVGHLVTSGYTLGQLLSTSFGGRVSPEFRDAKEMQMTLKSLVIAGLIITLSGCEALMLGNVLVYCATREEPELAVKELPIAHVGRPYSVRIDVVHASTGVSKLLVAPAKPLPEGLELSHQARDKHGVINGTPLKTGTYDVLIYGSTFGTQCAGQDVEQLYKIKVMK